MTARDTMRDRVRSPHGDTVREPRRDTVRDAPQSAPSAPDGLEDNFPTEELDVRAPGQPTDRVSTSVRGKFDPYRFQANTVPPGLRVELLRATPEEHPIDLMQDTLPPSRTVAQTPRAGDPAITANGDLHDLDEDAEEPAIPIPGRGRTVMLLAVTIAAVALIGLVLVVHGGPRPASEQPHQSHVAPREMPAAVVPDVPSPASAPIATQQPVAAATTSALVPLATSVAPPTSEPAVASKAPKPAPRVVETNAARNPRSTAQAAKSGTSTVPPSIRRGPDVESPLMP